MRYCTLTNTWTNFTRSQTCGIISPSLDTIFVGDADSNIIQQERKQFLRTDYADSDFSLNLGSNKLTNNSLTMQFSSVTDIDVGDVVTQDQTLTVYKFNSLLNALDLDPTVGLNTISSTSGTGLTLTVNTTAAHGLSAGDFVNLSLTNSSPSIDGLYELLTASGSVCTITIDEVLTAQATSGKMKRSYIETVPASSGQNMRTNIVELCVYLDSDPGLSFNNYGDRIGIKSGSISSNSVDNPTVLTSSGAHNLVDGRIVSLTGTNGSIPVIGNATYAVGNVGVFGSSSTCTIDVDVTTGGTTGITFSTSANLNDFEDIKACFNDMIGRLNLDSGATYNSYQLITSTTLFEAVVVSVNTATKKITLNLPLQWIFGELTIFNAIDCEFTYAPITNGNPLMSKHISDFTVMFGNKAFTDFTAYFSSDLMPAFIPVPIPGDGVGIFGSYATTGFGYGTFGGNSTSAPFRTYIPRNVQRCRFLNIKMNHMVARETWAIYGLTLTGEMEVSSRAYR